MQREVLSRLLPMSRQCGDGIPHPATSLTHSLTHSLNRPVIPSPFLNLWTAVTRKTELKKTGFLFRSSPPLPPSVPPDDSDSGTRPSPLACA